MAILGHHRRPILEAVNATRRPTLIIEFVSFSKQQRYERLIFAELSLHFRCK